MFKNKCIFIHIPKNAGTSVLNAFGYNGHRVHAKWFDYYESNPFLFEKSHKFAVVREPLARLYSAYNYVASGGNHSNADIALQRLVLSKGECFANFVDHVLDRDFLMFQNLFQPQCYYIFDGLYNCQVDTILRYESLQADWLTMSNSLGWTRQLPWVNKGTTRASARLDDRQLQKVYSLYDVDYRLLGYENVEL
ncbi:sulfotransferase family protein [Pseudoalteromonas holothuriae]|nr:sulfotransferase family protein [Pseudoalteromonas sp. CIP111951]